MSHTVITVTNCQTNEPITGALCNDGTAANLYM